MVARIVHISDLHFPSRDHHVADVLAEQIVGLQPNILAVTGDLVNHPFRGWRDVRGWLDGILSARPSLKILLLPGNHDVLWTGVASPWCWPATVAFRRAFPGWWPELYFDAAANVTFLSLDTNRYAAFHQGAEGKVYDRRLKRLQNKIHQAAKDHRIHDSTKVLLLHNHPLPVPFEGRDFLLHTRRADQLMRFMAENRIDLVLHGHKHRATWSHVRLGGTERQPFFLEILGAGSALKDSIDIDRRGHNFNLIDIAPNGMRSVRQFFKPRGAKSFEEATPSREESAVENLLLSRFRMPYRMQKTSWHLTVNDEGDGVNCFDFEGLVFNPHTAPECPLPKDFLEEGEASPYEIDSISPVQLLGSLRDSAEGQRVVFAIPPDEQNPATVRLRSSYLNNYVLDTREARERGFTSTTDSMDYLLRDWVECLDLCVDFPPSFVPLQPVLEVLEPLAADEINRRLTLHFSALLKRTTLGLSASLPSPPPNYRYRIRWELPNPRQASAAQAADFARRLHFEQTFLRYRNDPGNPAHAEIDETVVVSLECLFAAVEARVKMAMSTSVSPLNPESIDMSFWVCDRTLKKPALRMIRWTQQGYYRDVFSKFTLRIGEGNAGRAFKTGSVRVFDEAAAQNNNPIGFKRPEGVPAHKFLLSFPVIDPRAPLPLAVFSVGTTDAIQAAYLRSLTATDFAEILKELNGPREDLLEVCGL